MKFGILSLGLVGAALAKFPSKDTIDSVYRLVETEDLLTHKGTNGGVYRGETDHTPLKQPFGSYNYCYMPHPRKQSYEKVANAELVYVQYVQRHHKRTAYNIFPSGDNQTYTCDQLKSFFYDQTPSHGAHVYTDSYTSGTNPFVKQSAMGTCQFPQLTVGGFNDAHEHGKDLREVYNALFPDTPDNDTVFLRSSSNTLTKHTASGVLSGVWPDYKGAIPLKQQSELVDSVDAQFPCDKRDALKAEYQTTEQWKHHLEVIQPVVSALDQLAGTENADEWHESMDHFNDNLQARQCNGYDLPSAVTQQQANVIYNAGDWEWNYYFVAQPNATEYIQSIEGLFIAEILEGLKQASEGQTNLKFSHVFAHDGDIAPLAGALGIESLRWPGMGANIAMELWRQNDDGQDYVRILYCGAPIRSVHGSFIKLDKFIDQMSRYVPSDIIEFCSN